ncbi:MAG: ABC transporter ATP-binding protein [Propionibacteriaceae bacterium]|jgi:ABC-type dipeptide/oligopeptide/nickel transport system ATPase component|nr:ABC transporter ATP-binding protein [Propionibacteriaceae bacterium]
MTADLLRLQGLTVDLPHAGGWRRVLDHVDYRVAAGAAVAVVGESGSGKTMLMRSCLGLLPPGARWTWDAAEIDGVDRTRPGAPRPPVAMVFQDPMTSLNPVRRVGYHLAEVIRRTGGTDRRDVRDLATATLAQVGIGDPARRYRQYPHELSGGMRQRVMIAMALLARPKLLLADEPTTALDVTVQAQILDLIAELRATAGLTVVLVTHDLGIVAGTCDRIAVMRAGQIVEEGDVDQIFYDPAHPYTRLLLAARPGARAGLPGGEVTA